MNERPGPNASYWLATTPSTLPQHVYPQWLHELLRSGMPMPEQQPEAPQDSAVFPVGGTNAFQMQQYRPQPMAYNAFAAGRRYL